MSTQTRNSEKRTDPRPDYLFLGTDGDGCAHYYDTRNERVHVARQGDREHIELLGDRPVADWMEYVAAKRGWAHRNYGGWALVFDRLSDLTGQE